MAFDNSRRASVDTFDRSTVWIGPPAAPVISTFCVSDQRICVFVHQIMAVVSPFNALLNSAFAIFQLADALPSSSSTRKCSSRVSNAMPPRTSIRIWFCGSPSPDNFCTSSRSAEVGTNAGRPAPGCAPPNLRFFSDVGFSALSAMVSLIGILPHDTLKARPPPLRRQPARGTAT